ncbi:MAG: MFS transporter [Chloroflexota bacterium]|nr:MFS transporter [Chloroflexota bacterium]
MPPWPDSDPAPRKERFYYGWVVVLALLVIGIICFGVHYSFGVFFKPLQEELGWSRTATSGIYSAYVALSALFAVISGWALDRYGAKVIFMAMGVFTTAGLLLTSQVSSPWQIFVTYSLLLAIGTGGIYVVSMATVNRWFAKRRGLALGIVGLASPMGMMVMNPLAAYFIASYNWKTSFLIIGLMAFFIIIPCSQLLRKSPSEIASSSQHNKLEATDCDSSSEGLSPHQALRTRNFWLLLSIMFLLSSCTYVITAHLVPHAIDLDIPPIQAASLFSVLGGAAIAGRLLLGRASDTIGRKRAYLICSLLMAVSMLWLIKASDLWMFYVFAIIFGFGTGGLAPVNAAFLGDTFGLRHIGLIMGLIEIGWQTGAAAGAILAGYIFDISGGYTFAFIAGLTASLLVALLVLFLKEQNPSTSSQ